MPIINGRYYINPGYGKAVELARIQFDPLSEGGEAWLEPADGSIAVPGLGAKRKTPPTHPGRGVQQLVRDWTKPGACAQDTRDLAHCRACCLSAEIAHSAACGLLGLIPGVGEAGVAACEAASGTWSRECDRNCESKAGR